jgi:hypothetical protein
MMVAKIVIQRDLTGADGPGGMPVVAERHVTAERDEYRQSDDENHG